MKKFAGTSFLDTPAECWELPRTTLRVRLVMSSYGGLRAADQGDSIFAGSFGIVIVPGGAGFFLSLPGLERAGL